MRFHASLLSIVAIAIAGASPSAAQRSVPRFPGDTTSVAAPCDSAADDTADWPQAHGGTLPASFGMRIPPGLTELMNQSTRGASRAEFRAGPRSLAWLYVTGPGGGGVTSSASLAVARRCYLRVDGSIVQYWTTRVGSEYLAGALWGWAGADGGFTLLMHAIGPDSVWQRQALTAMRSVVFDTAKARRPKPPIP